MARKTLIQSFQGSATRPGREPDAWPGPWPGSITNILDHDPLINNAKWNTTPCIRHLKVSSTHFETRQIDVSQRKVYCHYFGTTDFADSYGHAWLWLGLLKNKTNSPNLEWLYGFVTDWLTADGNHKEQRQRHDSEWKFQQLWKQTLQRKGQTVCRNGFNLINDSRSYFCWSAFVLFSRQNDMTCVGALLWNRFSHRLWKPVNWSVYIQKKEQSNGSEFT